MILSNFLIGMIALGFVTMIIGFFANAKNRHLRIVQGWIMCFAGGALGIILMIFFESGITAADLKNEFISISADYSENMMLDDDNFRFVFWFPETENPFVLTAIKQTRLRLDKYNKEYKQKLELKSNKVFGKHIRLFKPCIPINVIDNPLEIAWIDKGS